MSLETDHPVVALESDRLHVALVPEPGRADQPQAVKAQQHDHTHHRGYPDDEWVVEEAGEEGGGGGGGECGGGEPHVHVQVDGREECQKPMAKIKNA